MKKISIVIAEDDCQIAEIQKRFIERVEGFELVGIAHGLTEAQDLVDVLKPDLLLLDVQFPQGSGLDLLRDLRAQNSATDVILITAAKEVSTLKEALRGGVFDYILKPLVFERLQEALNNYASHMTKLHAMESLMQTDVDNVIPRTHVSGNGPETETQTRLPKGVDSLTLDKISAIFSTTDEALNAEVVGNKIGASRTTARRYLEYLVSENELEAQVSYGSVGRPERRYIKR